MKLLAAKVNQNLDQVWHEPSAGFSRESEALLDTIHRESLAATLAHINYKNVLKIVETFEVLDYDPPAFPPKQVIKMTAKVTQKKKLPPLTFDEEP